MAAKAHSADQASQRDAAYALLLWRRARKPIPHYEADEELALVPYLDVMLNLVIFMLVTIASFMPLGILSIYPPTEATPAEAAAQTPSEKVTLTVAISNEKGFFFASNDVVEPPILRKPDGAWDFAALNERAAAIKARFPNEKAISIVADKQIRYEVLVKTMDALRTKGKDILFTEINLADAQ